MPTGGSTITLTADCHSGDQVYGGGAWMENTGGNGVDLVELEQSAPSGDLTKWYGTGRNDGLFQHDLHVFAVCGPSGLSFQ